MATLSAKAMTTTVHASSTWIQCGVIPFDDKPEAVVASLGVVVDAVADIILLFLFQSQIMC